MIRWWPHTLFGRLLLVLLGGLVIAQLLSTAIHWRERDTVVFRASTGRSAQRVADLVRVLEELDTFDRQRVVSRLSAPGFEIILGQPPKGEPGTHEELADIFQDMLAEQLRPERRVSVAVTRVHRGDPSAQQPFGNPPREYGKRYLLRVDTTLKDGRPITFDLTLPQRIPSLPARLLWHLVILLAVMSVLIFLAVRWVTRPLSTLASAAEELGRNIRRTPIDEQGPTEVHRAAHAFNIMQERLLRYVRTRENVLMAMSHDLKTPITRMRLRAELLEDSQNKEKFTRDLQEMESMVEATLNLMRGLDSEEPTRPVEVDALLESIVFDYQAMGKNIELDGSILRPLPARPLALKRCLQNLIDNAVKFGTRIHVTVSEGDKSITVRIRDNGPGIPEDELKRVFDPYYRVESSRNRETGGHGLGLTIACNIAESHGGSIMLRNLQGGGFEAVVTFQR